MRFIIYGAGGVGGTIGARLFQHGHEVVLIARGDHYRVILRDGLTLLTPGEVLRQQIAVVQNPAEIEFRSDDVVFLTMKSQHTWDALIELRAAAGPEVRVICCQNGVENERMAQRLFRHVYGMVVILPGNHFEPGFVECNSVNVSGILDAGNYPRGIDQVIEAVTSILSGSDLSARPDADIMRWKYSKLLMNLNNSLQAICGLNEQTRELSGQIRNEALRVFEEAGIDFATDAESKQRRGDLLRMRRIDGQKRIGGSSWQSLKNGKGDIESDFLNGEIVALGRMHGVPTPANHVMQFMAARAAREGQAPGSISIETIMDQIRAS